MSAQLLGTNYLVELAIEPQAYAISIDGGDNALWLEIIEPDGVTTKVTPTTRTNPSGSTSGLVSHNVLLDKEGTWQFNFLRGADITLAPIWTTNWVVALNHKDFATRLTREGVVVPPAPPAQDPVTTAQEVAVLGLSCPVRSWYRFNSSEENTTSFADYYGGEDLSVNIARSSVPSIIPLSSSRAYRMDGAEMTVTFDIDYLLEFFEIGKEVLVEGAGVGLGFYCRWDTQPPTSYRNLVTLPLVSDPGGIDLTHRMRTRTFASNDLTQLEITDGLGEIDTSYIIDTDLTYLIGWFWGRNLGASSYNYMVAIYRPDNPQTPVTTSRATAFSNARTVILEGQSAVIQNVDGVIDDVFIITTTGDPAPVSTIRQCFEDIYVAGQGP